MDLNVFQENEKQTVFSVLYSILNFSPEVDPDNQEFIETLKCILDCPNISTTPLLEIKSINISSPHARVRLIQLSILAALLSRPVKKEAVNSVQLLADHLEVNESATRVLKAVHNGQHLKARILTMRRGLSAFIKEAYATEGIMGIARFFLSLFFKVRVNTDSTSRYKRLGLLPEGTLGREYWKHMTELGFSFPGEKNGIPITVAYHDVSHVLNGYGTTPEGEIQQAAFQAGSRKEDGFFFVLFGILQFHHGIRLTPVARAEVGYFNPKKVIWALHRGAQCHVDVTHKWNYWPLMPLNLEEARNACAIIPKLNC